MLGSVSSSAQLPLPRVAQSSDASPIYGASRAVDGATTTCSLTADLPGSVWLAELAPRTPVIEAVQSEVPLEVLLGARDVHAAGTIKVDLPHHSDHAHDYETWTIERAFPVSRQAIERFASGLGEDIYRAKGFVSLEEDKDRRYIYQQVGARWSLEPGAAWEDEPRQTRIVVIGHRGATSAAALDQLLDPNETRRPGVSMQRQQGSSQ